MIAVADALSDALGIHLSQEAENRHRPKDVWQATFFTFSAKFFTALSFIVPLLLFPLKVAALVNIFWAVLLLVVFNFYLAYLQNKNPLFLIAEHMFIAALAVGASIFLARIVTAK